MRNRQIPLAVKKIEVLLVDAQALEKLIKDELGNEIDIHLATESSNGDYLLEDIDVDIKDYEIEELLGWLNGDDAQYNTHYLAMKKLCRDGKIPVGQYLISIFW